ncbi:MAG: hypothetical protein CMP65_01855 [Flavobacteriales bacterium]|nr:hypothetical protein [Flavobacteriales bacterium]|tara:strand:+ start:4872 stop:5831 length:960 start_codon:yes stop_codon:yes gene_type:complete
MKLFLKYLQPIFFLILGAGLLTWSLNGINFNNFTESLINIPLKWVFISMTLGYLAFIFRALRWKLLIESIGFSSNNYNLVHSIAFGYLFNSFIPRSGEIIRCTSLNKVTKIPTSKLLGHVVLERIIDFVILLILFMVSFVFNYKYLIGFFNGISIPPNVFNYSIILLLVCFLTYSFLRKWVKSNYLQTIITFISGIKQGFLSLKKVKNQFLFWLYTFCIWACYLFMTTICFMCFYETSNLNIMQGLFVMVAGGLGMVVPTPTGLGSYHYFVIKALTSFNVSLEISQYFAIIVHTSQALMIIVMGGIGMWFLYMNKSFKI